MYKHRFLVSGGTFDHFHKGHKAFIDAQLALSEKVLIGITSDAFAHQKEKEIEDYTIRLQHVKDYILSKDANERVEFAQIEDGDIPVVWDTYPIEAIAVTANTIKGAKMINVKREKQGLPLLIVYSIPEEIGADGNVISSQRIRKGEINRKGELYIDSTWKKQTLHLPDSLRATVSKPFGEVYPDFPAVMSSKKIDPNRLIVVGDVVTELFQKAVVGQKVSIIDLYINRLKQFNSVQGHTLQGDEQILSVKNHAGYITPELFASIKKSIFASGRYIILVDGEEDLSVLPAILLAPLEFVVVYGQPGVGIVSISVTENKKEEAKKLLEKFSILASN